MISRDEPLSWLTLERYALGELSAEERATVELRLAESETDRACLAEILQDTSQLPPLHKAHDQAAPASPTRTRTAGRGGRWLGVSAGLCAAAALLLVVLRDQPDSALGPAGSNAYEGTKGSDVALRLISERQGLDPHSFVAGERFKVQVTCPARLGPALRVLVFQAGQVYQPLPAPAGFACGSLVSWPGAFALDGSDPADVCLYWGARAAPSGRAELGRDAVCAHLDAR